MKIEIATDKVDAGMVLRLKGQVDMNTSSDVRCCLADVFRQRAPGFKALFIDLSQVLYMDSSGIATLIEAMQNCVKSGIRLRLVDLSPQVRDVFELARLSQVFEVYPNLAEASLGIE